MNITKILMPQARLLAAIVFTAALVGLSACQHAPTKVGDSVGDSIEVIEFEEPPKLEGSEIALGGFSGLTLDSKQGGLWTFKTLTDRGPNKDPLPLKGTKKNLRRPFLLPEFQPRWVEFTYNPATKSLHIDRQIYLTRKGRKMTGLPNKFGGEKWDELPVDNNNKVLRLDPMGVDPEAIARAEDGTYWIAEEYRPSLMKFSADGKLLKRYVPLGSPKGTGEQALPASYTKRRPNGGFEGVAYREGIVYGFLQQPLVDEEGQTHLLAIDAKTGKASADYLYRYEKSPEGWPQANKIGDGVALPDGTLLLVEQNTERGKMAIHSVYRVRLGQSGAFVQKELVADLVRLGLSDYGKVEGLTYIDATTLALVTDNDFGLLDSGKSVFILLHLAKPLY